MSYLILRFLHIVGFILLGGGLVAVFLADFRSRQTRDIRLVAEGVSYVAMFYDGVVVPGAILVGLSGLIMTLTSGFGFFGMPWLTGMWILFAFEFVEGNTITRLSFRRTLKLSRAALERGGITPELLGEMGKPISRFTHYLDLPLFFLIVSLGGLRPSTWNHFAVGIALAVLLALALMITLSRMRR